MKRKIIHDHQRYWIDIYLNKKDWKNKIGYIYCHRNGMFSLHITNYNLFNVSYCSIQRNSITEIDKYILSTINKPKRKIFHFKAAKTYKRGRNAIYKRIR